MTIMVEQDVLRFEVAVDDIKRMQVIQGERYLCRIKLGHWFRKPLTTMLADEKWNIKGTHIRPPQEGKQFASRYIVHDHVQIGVILECAPEIDDERMLNSL